MLEWFIAGIAVGAVAGLWIGKNYFNKVIKINTEDCVAMLKEKGYGVHLYGQNKEEKRGF